MSTVPLTAAMSERSARKLAAAVVIVAVAVRLVFFTGFFGSDEVVYVASGLQILNGEWPAGDYIGAIRQGVNLPIALSMWLFGVNETSAALWSFVASVAEVILVYVAGRELIGRTGALIAALLMSLLPLHAHFAGRLMADSPLALFITLTFFLFWKAERSPSAKLFFLAGLAAGAVFWIKESVLVFVTVFAAYPIFFRRVDWRWGWMMLGAGLMVAANCALFWHLNGDPLHVFNVARVSIDRFVASTNTQDSPAYYLRYLLLDMRHTWLLGWLALLGVVWALRRRVAPAARETGVTFVVFWALTLLTVFSLLVVSVSPLRFVMKQTNYMMIFLAPLCLLAGWWVASLQVPARVAILAVFVAGALPLLALEQLAIESFAANSKATLDFARSHANASVYGLKNAQMAGRYYDTIFARADGSEQSLIAPLDNAPGLSKDAVGKVRSPDAIAVVDLQTLGWARDPVSGLGDLPACWQRIGQLNPRLSPVASMTAAGLLSIIGASEKLTGLTLPSSARALVQIKPAFLYSTASCRWRVATRSSDSVLKQTARQASLRPPVSAEDRNLRHPPCTMSRRVIKAESDC